MRLEALDLLNNFAFTKKISGSSYLLKVDIGGNDLKTPDLRLRALFYSRETRPGLLFFAER